MKKQIIAGVVAGLALAGAVSTSVSAAKPDGAGTGAVPAGVACQQAGISTLVSLGLIDDVAKGGIEVVGIGTLPLRTVVAFHRTNPEFFQTGGVSVVVPGLGVIPAEWCNTDES